jgi:NAD-dependent SIR2 family protein deacetylase
MSPAEFLRVYHLRAPHLMWLLGAGASAASGIRTAGDMIWDFKRRIYCSEQKVPLRACEDLGDPRLLDKVQEFFDRQGTCPPRDSLEEYAFYFSRVYPSEADRRKYIEELTSKGTPSYGHTALALLLKKDLARIIWTTNFDKNVEDAAAKAFGRTGSLLAVDLEAPHLFRQASQEGRWPLLGKLHGDFQSRRLKNTEDELRSQDAELRQCLVRACQAGGLVVVGYSGRDESVMDALEEAIDQGNGFPQGLFWIARSSGAAPRVAALLEKARAAGVTEAHLIEVPTFDELLADVVGQCQHLSDEEMALLNEHARRVSDAPLVMDKGGWPVIRLNAIEVVRFPNTCRLVKAEIGGMKQVRETITRTGANIIASRRKAGVLLFGSDAEARKAFVKGEFDIYTLEDRRLRYPSPEQSLIYDALVRALVRERPLLARYRAHHPVLFVDPSRRSDPIFQPLTQAAGSVCGVLKNVDIPWSEAVSLRLSYRLNKLWLVFEPTVWPEYPADESKDEDAIRRQREFVKEFQRERAARRYNRAWNGMLQAWCHVFCGGDKPADLQAFGISNGVDARFALSPITGFSRRQRL